MPHVAYQQYLCSQSSFKLESLSLSLLLGSIYSSFKILRQQLFLKIAQDRTETSQRLPPLNSYSTECLDGPSGIQPVLILSLVNFLCTHPEFPIRCPFEDNSTCLLLAFLLYLGSAIPVSLCLIGTPSSTWEKPYLLLLKTSSANQASFSENCIYLFNKYLFIHYICVPIMGQAQEIWQTWVSVCWPEALWNLVEPQPPTT